MRSINPKIVEYIKYYASQGHSIDKVKQFLLANNISQSEIDEAINYINQSNVSNTQNSYNQNTQVNQANNYVNNSVLESQIKNYIQTQLNNGYNIEIIKSALIRQGINSNIINKVASDLNNVNINVKHEVNISKGTIIGVVAAIFIVGLVVFGIFNFSIFKPSESLMDITISTTAYSYLPGENLNYQIHVTNMGSIERFDATIKYLVIDDTRTVITRKEETLAVQTTTSNNRNIQLPQTIKPGKYYLQAIAEYGSKSATSKSEFEVVQKIEDKKPDTYVPPTESKPTTPTIPTTENTPTTPNVPTTSSTGKTLGEVLTEVKILSQTNPDAAASECLKLASTEQKDICYSTIADSSRSYEYCDRISKIEYKDNCYLAFAIKENLDICNKISDNSSKALCEQLILIQLMDKYYRENNTAKILELSQKFNPSVIQPGGPKVQTYEYTYNEQVSILDIINTETPNTAPVEPIPPVDNQTENGTI